jgi:hypothetical protein
MRPEVELKTIVRYETMNGREVPIYRITRYTAEDVKIANEEAQRKLEEELGKPSNVKEILTILKEHAEDYTGEKVEPKVIVEGKPKLVER